MFHSSSQSGGVRTSSTTPLLPGVNLCSTVADADGAVVALARAEATVRAELMASSSALVQADTAVALDGQVASVLVAVDNLRRADRAVWLSEQGKALHAAQSRAFEEASKAKEAGREVSVLREQLRLMKDKAKTAIVGALKVERRKRMAVERRLKEAMRGDSIQQ